MSRAYLKLFTFLDRATIAELERAVETNPERREAQRVLAAECTGVVHGEAAVKDVERASAILFGSWEESPSVDVVETLTHEIPSTVIARAEIAAGVPLLDLLIRTRIAESKGAARKLIEGGGVYLNNVRETVPQRAVALADVRWPDAMLLRSGKKNYHLLRVTGL